MPQSPSITHWGRLKQVAFGYLAACILCAVLLTLHFLLTGGPPTSSVGEAAWSLILMTGFLFVMTTFVAFPGFLLFRLCLKWLKRDDILSFSMAGALLGGGLTLLMAVLQTRSLELILKYPPSPIFVILGGLAGLVAWATERWAVRG
jgi:hypothetical protein